MANANLWLKRSAFPAPPPCSLQDTVPLPLQISGSSPRAAGEREKVPPCARSEGVERRVWGGEFPDIALWSGNPRCASSNAPLTPDTRMQAHPRERARARCSTYCSLSEEIT